MPTPNFECLETLFSDIDSSPVNPCNSDLSQADLINADLRFANLQGVNLAGANLQGANLSGADLQRANLNRTNFNGATLKGTNLTAAQIVMGSFIGADLSGASLVQSSLDAAIFSHACLRGADLRGAYLIGADFSNSQLQRSYYSSTTYFDKGFSPKKAYMLTEVQITYAQALTQLNLLGQAAQNYLGEVITARYWEASHAQVEGLDRFKVRAGSAHIQLLGSHRECLGFSELQSAQTWVNHFIVNCTQVIRHFPQLLEHDRLSYTLSAL
jgi:uncharacterized protein YjbI with pentapeptide repeats